MNTLECHRITLPLSLIVSMETDSLRNCLSVNINFLQFFVVNNEGKLQDFEGVVVNKDGSLIVTED